MIFRKLFPHVVLAALLVTIPLLLCAGSVGRITGIITDVETGKPLIGATIQIEGIAIAARSDFDGNFVLLSVPPGTYKVMITMMGYNSVIIEDVKVAAESTTDLKIQMSQASTDTEKTTIVKASKGEIKVNQTGKVSTATKKNNVIAPVADIDELLSRESGQYNGTDGQGHNRVGGPGQVVSNGVQYGDGKSQCSERQKPICPLPPPYYHDRCWYYPGDKPFDAMFFKNYGVNPFIETEDDHLSTFAVDIDDASFIMTRSYLDRGHLPPADAIRIEEFINHFDYGYESPRYQPFEVYLDGAPSHFGQGCELLRIGVQGQDVSRCERKPANLIFLVDVSGSMNRENRLDLVKDALMYLVDQLDAGDRVGLVVYDTYAREVFKPISVRNRHDIYRALCDLRPGGSTNLDQGLKLAYHMAERHYQQNRINRIVLCSDGVANVGTTSAEELLRKIKRFADRGITLTAIGVGMGNHNDALLEQLGDRGNGHYAYVDHIDEARRVFVEKLTGTLQVIARDVKIQVDFNPEIVRSYRLLGYENRDVADHKFRDDREDGGEIGAGHQVTALYEIKLWERKRAYNLGRVFIRYKDAEGEEVAEITCDIPQNVFARRFESSAPQFRLAAAAAEFSEILKKSYWARGSSLSDVYTVARRVARELNSSEVDELLNMIRQAQSFDDALAEYEW